MRIGFKFGQSKCQEIALTGNTNTPFVGNVSEIGKNWYGHEAAWGQIWVTQESPDRSVEADTTIARVLMPGNCTRELAIKRATLLASAPAAIESLEKLLHAIESNSLTDELIVHCQQLIKAARSENG